MKKKENITSVKIISLLAAHRRNLDKYDVESIGLFGSAAHNKAGAKSDIDILVRFSRNTFDNYMGLKFYLEKLLKRKVDLVIESSLKPALKYVKKEAVYA